jgi:hypothetical protein
VGLVGAGLGTGMLRGGANYCGRLTPGRPKGLPSVAAPGSAALPAHVAFLNRISPFTVERFNDRPPDPIVPCILRLPKRPVIVRG